MYGKVSSINNFSGHFRPTVEESRRIPELLQKLGFETSGALFRADSFKFNADGLIADQVTVVNIRLSP